MYKMHTHILAFGIRLKQVGSFKLTQAKFSVMPWVKAWRRPTIILDMTVKKKSLGGIKPYYPWPKAETLLATLSQDISTVELSYNVMKRTEYSISV
jgi:hypothetical protein